MSLQERLDLIGTTNPNPIEKTTTIKNETPYILTYEINFSASLHDNENDTEYGLHWSYKVGICSTDVEDCAFDNPENILLTNKYSTYYDNIEDENYGKIKYDASLIGWGGGDVRTYDNYYYDTASGSYYLEIQPGEEYNVVSELSTTHGTLHDKGSRDTYIEFSRITWAIIGAKEVV